MAKQQMALRIKTFQDLELLSEINGISISTIEERSRPCFVNNKSLPDWRCRSLTGFLGVTEKFLDCLRNDWIKVLNLGTTHYEFATHLRNILQTAEERRKKKNWGPDHVVVVKYDVTAVQWGTLKSVGLGPQRLTVSHYSYLGTQWSLFYNLSYNGTDQSDRTLSSHCHIPYDNLKWNEDYTIVNDAQQIEVTIAGGLRGGIINYIENFGFYEGGGPQNPYRVDPDKLFSLLTGRQPPKSPITSCDMLNK
jgi:hypothetical protein